ncbi:uncharacterized protein LOC112542953 [Python bivittatus]|uniref:Uncharacterized protein LOC112542953 n=1 Tax=Python bivittatus TaxID=176946 RepID=A0A9F5JCN2_PYTBI|nr:uncharacterized protein LOC112542953 [Python bivittatus]
MKEGECLLLFCLAEGGLVENRFHFYMDGAEITSSHEWLLEGSGKPTNPLQNASLSILHAKPNHSGEFACSYEEKRGRRWITSSWSQGVNVTVCSQDFDTMWKYIWLVVPFIILLAAFAFYCWKNKNKSEAEESKGERDDLGMMDPQTARAAAPSLAKDSEVTYSVIQVSSTQPAPGPTRKDRLPPKEEEMVLYSDVLFQPIKGRARKHTVD